MRPPEEVKRELIHQWLGKAEEDLEAAKILLAHEKPFLFAAGFHSQQAAEKYLKAFLTWRQIEFPKTHDLIQLLRLIGSANPALAADLKEITALNPYGVDIRYPGDVPDLAPQDARQAVELAEKAREKVLEAMKGWA